MKVSSITSKVDDLYGLYVDLKKAEFKVKNVGADSRGTYVYLDDAEEKDPASLIESWVGQPEPQPSLSLRKKRIKEFEELAENDRKRQEEEARLAEEKRMAAIADADKAIEATDLTAPLEGADESVAGELLAGTVSDESAKGDSFLRKIWKKLF